MGQGDELGILPRFCEELFERIKCWNEVLLQYDLILFKGALSSFDSIGENVSVQIILDYFICLRAYLRGMLVWYLDLGVGLLYGRGCLLEYAHPFGGNNGINCRFVILRWTVGTSGSLSLVERHTISVRNSLHELLNRSIHFAAQNNKFIHYVLIFNIAPVHGGNKLL